MISRDVTRPLGLSPEEKRHLQETVGALVVAQRETAAAAAEAREIFYRTRMQPLERWILWLSGMSIAALVVALMCFATVIALHAH